MTTRDQAAQTHAYADAVAKALGDGWAYAQNRDADGKPPWFATITRPDGAGLHLSREYRTGRYQWSGTYPRDTKGQDHMPYNATRPSITTSPDKAPEQAARDVTRRLLPEYLALLEQCQARVAQANDYATTTARNAAKLAAMLNTVPDERPRNGDACVRFHRGEYYGDVTVNGESIRIDVRSLTVEQAARVLRVLVVTGCDVPQPGAPGLRTTDGRESCREVGADDEAA